MKRQQTPADFCNVRNVSRMQSSAPHACAAGVAQLGTKVLVRPTIVVGAEDPGPPLQDGTAQDGIGQRPTPTPAAHAHPPAGPLTLRLGSPDPSFPLTRQQLVIPTVRPAELGDPSELMQTIALARTDDRDDLMQTVLRQPTQQHETPDPEDLIHTISRTREHDPEDFSKTQRVEPHEFLDTIALRELALPPEIERRLPPPPPRPSQARTNPPSRRPPPLTAAARAATAATPPHALGRTIKHAQPAARQPTHASTRPTLWTRLRARRPVSINPAWLWAAGLGACSMFLAYAITDRIVSAHEPDRVAVLREQNPSDIKVSAPSIQSEMCATAGSEAAVQAGANAP
jgi:hypothetical protein